MESQDAAAAEHELLHLAQRIDQVSAVISAQHVNPSTAEQLCAAAQKLVLKLKDPREVLCSISKSVP